MAMVAAERMMDPAWLGERIGQEVVAVRIRDQEKMGGMSGEFKFLEVDL